MLRNNFTPFGELRFQSGGAVTSFGTERLIRHGRLYENARFSGQKSSIPGGYTQAYRAAVPALVTSGRIAARLGGESGITADVVGVGVIAATLAGDATLGADAYLGLAGQATLSGNSSLTADIVGVGVISATISAGAQPSAFDIAQEVIGTIVKSGVNMRQVLWLVASYCAGKTNIDNLGGGNATVTFRGPDDTNDVITASMTGSERTSVTLDLD